MSNALTAAQELSCPNCGAPGKMPEFGNAIQCEYCGTLFFIPEVVRPNVGPEENITTPDFFTDFSRSRSDITKWVRWLIILIVITTAIPIVCGVFASVCGMAAAFFPFFAR